MGINLKYIIYSIDKYISENCYIPSQDKCFIKCYIYLKQYSNINSEYTEKFLFNTQEKNRKGIMKNSKISKFNKYFNESHQCYNPNDRHIYPKLKEKSENEMIIYLHFNSENDPIGHYCLVNKENIQLEISEIKDNFKKNWKRINDNVSKTGVHFTSLKDNSEESNTYIWDLETHPYMNSKNERINRPYACACINL